MIADIDPQTRLKRILTKALDGCSYESSAVETPGFLVLTARRQDGQKVRLRFRGVKESQTDIEPLAGAPLRLRGVSGLSWFALFIPPILRQSEYSQRVRIEAGAARLEIVCEDVEWWEESAPG